MGKKRRRVRIWTWCGYYARNFFCEYKTPFLIMSGVAVFGLIAGIIAGTTLPAEYYTERYVSLLKVGEFNPFWEFFKLSLLGLGLLALTYFGCFKPWMKFFTVMAIFYAGFRLGMGVVCAIIVSVVPGIIAMLIFYLPVYLCLICCLSVFHCVHRHRGFWRLYAKFGLVLVSVNVFFILVIPSVIKIVVVF